MDLPEKMDFLAKTLSLLLFHHQMISALTAQQAHQAQQADQGLKDLVDSQDLRDPMVRQDNQVPPAHQDQSAHGDLQAKLVQLVHQAQTVLFMSYLAQTAHRDHQDHVVLQAQMAHREHQAKMAHQDLQDLQVAMVSMAAQDKTELVENQENVVHQEEMEAAIIAHHQELLQDIRMCFEFIVQSMHRQLFLYTTCFAATSVFLQFQKVI